MAGNAVVPIMLLSAGAVAVWAGINDPKDGVFGGLAALMRGAPVVKRTATGEHFQGAAAQLQNIVGGAAASNSNNAGGGAVVPIKSSGAGLDTGVPKLVNGSLVSSQYSLGAVKPHVSKAANEIGPMFSVKTIHGVGSRSNKSDHPLGLALDFMVTGTKGDMIATYVLANAKRLKVKYVIWKQRINSLDGQGWRKMDDRGSATANHFDHVHVSFHA